MKRKQKYYALEAVEKLISDAVNNHGYTLVQITDGTLGAGYCVLVSPSDKMYNFIIKEVCLNEWTSSHTIRRRAVLSKEVQKDVDAAMQRVEVDMA